MLARSKIHTEVEYVEEKQPLGSGGFRKTFKATSRHKDFAGRIWVIEHYLPEALKCIADTGQTVEGILPCKSRLESQASKEFGDFLRYREIFHGETDGGEFVAVEGFIAGCFLKYINNTGSSSISTQPANVSAQKAECLVHFS